MTGRPYIGTINSDDTARVDALTQLTFEAFQEHAPAWLPTSADARRQVTKALASDRHCFVLFDPADQAAGWIGAIPIHHGRMWEIHPLCVAVGAQGRGYGRMLVSHVEVRARHAGVLGLIAGTSDSTNATSLYGIDLYQNPLEALINIRSKRRHPYQFWLKAGFTIVGVMPDADGLGMPAITLAKRVGR